MEKISKIPRGENMKKVLLYSGGVDSYMINQIWKPDVKLYVDMNTRYSKQEIARLPEDVIVTKLDLSEFERSDAVIPARNLYLLTIATNYGDEICLGATADDRQADKTIEFAEKASDILSFLHQEQFWTKKRDIKVNLEFSKLTKSEILQLYVESGGNLEKALKESFTCYTPIGNDECWNCKACHRKYITFKIAGCKFDIDTERKCIDYIERKVLGLIKNGTYGGGDIRGKQVLEIYNNFKKGDIND